MWAQVKLLVQMYVVICVLGAATCRHHENNNKRKHQRSSQDGSSENEEENLLDVPRRESSASPDTIAERKKAEVPKFMMDLYHKYKDSEGIRAGRLVANTVRSIQPDIGIVNQAKLYVVNLTSIGQYERALKGEIYLYKKRMKSKFRKSDIVITTHELAPTSIRVLSDVILPGRTRGWQALDVTQDLRSCLGSQGRSNHMLAFSFTLKDKNGSSSDLSTMPDFDAFKDILSRPYLVVYSNDTQKLSLDHIEPHFNTAEYLTNTFVNPENGRQEQFIDWMGFNERKPQRNRKNKHRQSLGDIDDDPLRKESELFEEDDRDSNKLDTIFRGDEDGEEYDVLLNLDGKKRNVRSIHDNKIPEDPFNPQWPPGRYNVPPIHPNVLQGTVESRHRVHDNRASSVEELERRRNRKRGRRRHRKNRDRKDGNKDSSSSPGGAPFSDLWTRQTGRARDLAPAAPAPITDTEVCGKRTLVVDFADIGWRDWIIAPTSFKAQYCSGTCPFPLNKESLADDIGDGPEGGDTLLSPYSKLFTRTSPSPALREAAGNQELNPSNHATIQSLMHLVGINKRVPAPCCVPDKLSSVTLLFFDSNKNVVLKNYPGMTVESCACR